MKADSMQEGLSKYLRIEAIILMVEQIASQARTESHNTINIKKLIRSENNIVLILPWEVKTRKIIP